MKVGDLVSLSAYGRKRKRAGWIHPGDIGLVVKVVEHNHFGTEYEVHWMKSKMSRSWSWSHERMSTRKDLRYVK